MSQNYKDVKQHLTLITTKPDEVSSKIDELRKDANKEPILGATALPVLSAENKDESSSNKQGLTSRRTTRKKYTKIANNE